MSHRSFSASFFSGLVLGGLCACVAEPEPGARDEGEPEATRVTVAEAASLLQRFEREAPSTRAQLFGRPVLQELLKEGASPSLWLLFGLDPMDGREHLVLAADGGGQAFDRGTLCPPVCPSLIDPRGIAAERVAGAGARISAALARTLTETFRATHPGEHGGVCLARAELGRLLADPKVEGLWFLYGRGVSGERAVVLAGVGEGASLLSHGLPGGATSATSATSTFSVAVAPCPAGGASSWR